MPSTYTLIKGETIGSAAKSYNFTAIPSTFTDLCLRISVRSNDVDFAPPYAEAIIRPNGSAYDPSYTYLYGNGSTASSGRDTLGFANGYLFQAPATDATSNTFNNLEYYLPNYTVTQKKPSSLFNVFENNSTTANESQINVTAGLMADSTAAITSLLVYCNWGSFVSGSSFYLYGISNA